MLRASARWYKTHLLTYVHTPSNSHKLGIPRSKCTGCNEVMMIAKNVIDCLGCLQQFRQINGNPYLKQRLDLGWGLPITSMPAI